MKKNNFPTHATKLTAIFMLLFFGSLMFQRVNAGVVGDYPEYPYSFETNYDEALRGQYHFSPQSGWMNDINAPIYYRGEYHLFYQHTPHQLTHSEMHWGHATSTDLLHWTHKNIALEPGVHDVGPLWSGSGWVDTNNVTGLKATDHDPILLYTSVDGVALVYSTNGGKTFKAYNNGEKIITLEGTYSRDPKVQWDPVGQQWILVLYVQNPNRAKFYRSTDLLNWTETSEFVADSWFEECPDLFRLPVNGDVGNYKWILMDASGNYVIGQLDSNGAFTSDWGVSNQKMELGETGFFDRNEGASEKTTWYASQTFNQHPSGKVVQMGWQPGNHGSVWTGNASFPVELALKQYPEGVRITRNPISAIQSLRYDAHTWSSQLLGANSGILSGLQDDAYELDATFDLSGTSASYFGFNLGVTSSGTSPTKSVIYHKSTTKLNGKLLPPSNNLVRIRLLVDRGQLEIFGNDGKFVISDNVDFDLAKQYIKFVSDGTVKLSSLKFYRLNKTWTPAPREKSGNAISFTPSLVLPNDGSAQVPKCVDRDIASGKVQIWSCLGNNNQTWNLHSDGTLRNFNVCMEVPSTNLTNGALVRVNSCTGANNQKWYNNTRGQLVNSASGRCLDLAYGMQQDGSQLQIWDCWTSPNPNQQWRAPESTRSGRFQWNISDKCLEANFGNGKAEIWDCEDSDDYQSWSLSKDGTLQAMGKCLTQPSGNMANGAKLTVQTCTTLNHQKWTERHDGKLMNNASKRCLDLEYGNSTNGKQLQIWDCWNSFNANQTWVGPF